MMSLLRRWLLGSLCFPLLYCTPSEQGVEETGYFNGGQVVYSSASPLSASLQPVLIVGLPGALGRAQGLLTITSPSDEASAMIGEQDGRFLLEVAAQSGEKLELVYQLEGGEPPRSMLQLVLADGLESLQAPQLDPGTGTVLLSASPQGVQVNLGNLENGTPPYVALNQRSGDIALANDLSPVQLPANAGDVICVFQLSRADSSQGSGLTSPTLCETF